MKRNHKDSMNASVCAEWRPGDGVPPHVMKKERQASRARSKPNHHAMQFAKAAAASIGACLDSLVGLGQSHATEDTELSLEVLGASLQNGGSVLEVVIQSPVTSWEEIRALEQRIEALGPHLRARLAAETRRRRTPHLRLRVVPPQGQGRQEG